MAGELTTEELRIASHLRSSGVDAVAAPLVTAMAIRKHNRPRGELVHILRQYQGLEDPVKVDRALQYLIDGGFLTRYQADGRELIRGADDLRDKLLSKITDGELAARLVSLSDERRSGVALLGRIDSPSVYGTYEDCLRGAQREISWPMVATSPNLESVAILRERALAGVRVRVLIADPDLAAGLRGESMRQTSIEAIRGWTAVAQDTPRIELRVVSRAEHMLVPSSTLVDGSLLRLNIHDPARQRSLEGVMLQVEGHDGVQPNLLQMAYEHFDKAWRAARPLGALQGIRWWIREHWVWAAFGLFALLALTLGPLFGEIYVAITTSVAATFLVNGLVSDGPKLMGWLRRPSRSGRI